MLTLHILLLVTCAANTNFELGRGNKIGGWEPKPVPSLEDTPIIQIASGGYHSLALTGKVIGSNHISLAVFALRGYHCALLVFIKVSCYSNPDDGKVLSWGYGGHGQLGHSSIQNEKVPRVVDALADQRVIYIACGGSSSGAITGSQWLSTSIM